MPGDDLTSVPDLLEAHQRALAGKLGITSLRALADADQRAIYTALASLRPRPTLGRIAAWQADARRRLSDASEWHRAASFAVIFTQRQVDGGWERRIEAEQTEVEPEPSAQEWAGWDCGPLCDWMLSQLDQRAGAAAPDAAAPDAGAASAPAGPAGLRINNAAITDARQTLDLIRDGAVLATAPDELSPPVQLSVTVTGGRSGQQLRTAVWFRRGAQPGWSPADPVSVPESGQVEFDLSSVPPGGHALRLLAWATEPGASLAVVMLPRLTFRADPE